MRVLGFGLLALSAVHALSTPDLDAKGSWGDANPFAQVINGQSNKLLVTLQNHADRDLTVKRISGSFSERTSQGTERFLKNSTTSNYNTVVPQGQTVTLSYAFSTEFRPRELQFAAFVDYADPEGQQYRETAYEGQVTVLERKGSWFDPALLFAYATLLALIGGAGYLGYNLYLGSSGTNKKKKPTRTVAPVVETEESLQAQQDEWLPAHHKSTRSKKVGATSGDETSGTEGEAKSKRRSNRKK